MRLNDDELFPLGKKKRAKKAPKGPKQPLPLPTAGDIDVDYSKYTVKVLKDLLRDRGLPVSGRRKADYVERLAADDIRLQQEAPAVAEDEEEDLDDEDEEEEDDDDDDDDDDEEEEEEDDAGGEGCDDM